MPRKPNRRSDRFADRERLLAAIGACWEGMTREQSRMEVCGRRLSSQRSTALR